MKITLGGGRILSIIALIISVPSIYMSFYLGAYIGIFLTGILIGCEVKE